MKETLSGIQHFFFGKWDVKQFWRGCTSHWEPVEYIVTHRLLNRTMDSVLGHVNHIHQSCLVRHTGSVTPCDMQFLLARRTPLWALFLTAHDCTVPPDIMVSIHLEYVGIASARRQHSTMSLQPHPSIFLSRVGERDPARHLLLWSSWLHVTRSGLSHSAG